MTFNKLYSKEIYPLPLNDGYLVYAPLSGLMVAMSEEQVQRLENADGEAYTRLLAQIEDKRRSHRTIPCKTSVSELHKLTILPTFRCNFKCTYCYSAQGRQNKTLDFDTIRATVDYFINRKRTDLQELWLAVLGGGEPFLTPELTEKTIRYAVKRAEEQGFKLGIGLTTNGSIYSEALSKTMTECGVNLGVSFEVLEDIQNVQRQNYGKVVECVSRYMNDGVDITVKSIITPQNVNRLESMVGELHRLFPKVRKYKLQIVEDPVIFADLNVMRQFYADFTRNFFSAQQLGQEYGINVYVLASQYIDMLVEHYCGGEMCLNPEGTITVCHRFSSPLERQYNDVLYGCVKNGKVEVDDEKFKTLISHDIHHNVKCRTCFAKWHCGGGCRAQASIYSEEQLEIICQWTRSFIKTLLEKRFTESE